jgi:hypothetical protein
LGSAGPSGSSGLDATSPVDRTDTSLGDTAAPPDDTDAPPDDTDAPPDDTTAPPDDTTAPLDDTTAPGASELTLHQACVERLNRVCNRFYYECYGFSPVADPCPDIVRECPDLYSSEGARVTIEELLDCADRWEATSCEALLAYEWPMCDLTPGTRQDGEMCAFDTQCAALNCVVTSQDPTCGYCAEPLSDGEPCDTYDACRTGSECIDGTCTPVPPLAAAGEPCERYGLCEGGNRCVQLVDDAEAKCQALPSPGEPCPVDYSICASGAYCDEQGMCQASAGMGEPCSSGGSCAVGLTCIDDADGSNHCGPRRVAGESCTTVSQARYPAGNCADGYHCVCDADECSDGVCKAVRYEGESCSGAEEYCTTGTACEGGSCVATGHLGLFEQCAE